MCGEMSGRRVLLPDSPARPRPEKRLLRLTGLRGGRGGVPDAAAALGCRGGPLRRYPRSVDFATCSKALPRRHDDTKRLTKESLVICVVLRGFVKTSLQEPTEVSA